MKSSLRGFATVGWWSQYTSLCECVFFVFECKFGCSSFLINVVKSSFLKYVLAKKKRMIKKRKEKVIDGELARAFVCSVALLGKEAHPTPTTDQNSPGRRPRENSRVATADPTWHPGDAAIWSRPRLAIRPAVGTHSASVVLFNERIWANIWLPGGVAATPCRPGGVLPLLFKPGGIKRGPWISKVTKP